MKDFFVKVGVSIVSAAIIGTAGALWQMNSRLSAIETKLSLVKIVKCDEPAVTRPGPVTIEPSQVAKK